MKSAEVNALKNKLLISGLILIVAVLCGGSRAGAQQGPATEIVGGPGGAAYLDPEPERGARVIEVQVHAREFVNAVQLIYLTRDGRTVSGPYHGGPRGFFSVFHLEEDEHLIGIAGRSGTYVDSIQFMTNKRTSPTFGGRGGDHEFHLDIPPDTEVAGFTGRSGEYVDAIGLTFSPIRREFHSRRFGDPDDSPRSGQSSLAGGAGGSVFADADVPEGAEILEVRVNAEEFVDSVQVVYTLRDGRTIVAARHGGNGGRPASFLLEQGEYIVGISGRSGRYVDSFRIQTNRRMSQVFGGRGGDRDFQINVPEGNRAAGFAGRSGEYVDAIGLTYTETPERHHEFHEGRHNR